MSNTPKILRTHTDRFNLFKDGRKLGANKRNYILSSVRAMFESAETKELLRTGEAYGYYGHGHRYRAGKLSLGETEIINIDGKPVVVDNVPACRTTDITIEDDGTVTHTQEIFDTTAGRIVDSLIASGAGGWSWATSGQDSKAASYARTYAGMDYVLQPNYLSIDHPAMMMESAEAETMLLESLQKKIGLDEENARLALELGQSDDYLVSRVSELEQEIMIMESVRSQNDSLMTQIKEQEEAFNQKQAMLLEAMESLPIYLTENQRRAVSELKGPEDLKVITNMFESLGRANFGDLPIGHQQSVSAKPASDLSPEAQGDMISFSPRRFFK